MAGRGESRIASNQMRWRSAARETWGRGKVKAKGKLRNEHVSSVGKVGRGTRSSGLRVPIGRRQAPIRCAAYVSSAANPQTLAASVQPQVGARRSEHTSVSIRCVLCGAPSPPPPSRSKTHIVDQGIGSSRLNTHCMAPSLRSRERKHVHAYSAPLVSQPGELRHR